MFNSYVREEIAGLLRQILEETGLFQQRLSELLEKNNQDLLEELEVVFRAGDAVDDQALRISILKNDLMNMAMGSITTAQVQFQWCEIPWNDATNTAAVANNTVHSVHSPKTCQKDPRHIFCKNHGIMNFCPCCGGTLK